EPVAHRLGDPLPVGWILQHAVPAERRAARLELRLDQEDAAGGGGSEHQCGGQSELQRNEAHIADEKVGPDAADHLKGEIPRVEALNACDTWVGAELRVHLTVADIYRRHMPSAPLEQY